MLQLSLEKSSDSINLKLGFNAAQLGTPKRLNADPVMDLKGDPIMDFKEGDPMMDLKEEVGPTSKIIDPSLKMTALIPLSIQGEEEDIPKLTKKQPLHEIQIYKEKTLDWGFLELHTILKMIALIIGVNIGLNLLIEYAFKNVLTMTGHYKTLNTLKLIIKRWLMSALSIFIFFRFMT